MPEVINNYIESKYRIIGPKDIYASIGNTYKSDVVKVEKICLFHSSPQRLIL
jgi:hypothetical protein